MFSFLGLSAIAQVESAVPVAKEARTGDIYVSGLPGYQKLSAEYGSLPKTSKKTVNECGFFKLSASSGSAPIALSDSLQVEGRSAVTVSDLPIEAVPKCTNGTLSGTPSAALRDSDGDVYFTGLTPFASVGVSYLSLPTTRSVTANTCGIAKLSSKGDYEISSGSIVIKNKETGATVATISEYSTLLSVEGGPVCRNGAALFSTDWPTN